MSNQELGAYVSTHTEKRTASWLPRDYHGPASGLVPSDGTEPRSRIIRALKLAGYHYVRRMNFWA
jgi:hypothetical protein